MSHTILAAALLLISIRVSAQQGGGVRTRTTLPSPMAAKASVPAMFIFGDSLIDSGNNNDLASLAKANYYPYGIDFSAGATGRFSNGYTMVDEIAQLLGLPLLPAFSGATAEQSMYGVNYASAAAGILDDSGGNFVGRIPFNQQIQNFQGTVNEIAESVGGADATTRALGRCLYFIGMGSNDYLNNYLMPNYATRSQYNAQQFADLLIQNYSAQLIRLYNLGGRRFALAGLGLMGCIPSILAQSSNGRCSDEVNQLVRPFNANMKTMVDQLNARLPDARFTYIDVFRIFQDILSNSPSYGLRVVNRGCCGVGRNQGQITCLPFQTPCPNRDQYVFWDAFHPTQAVNIILGRSAYDGGSSYVHPLNIKDLASL